MKIGPRKQVIVERTGAGRDYPLTGDAIGEFYRTFLENDGAEENLSITDQWREIEEFERLKEGLQRYY